MVDRDANDVLGETLGDETTWARPSPHVRDAVLAAIAAEVAASTVVPITPEVADWAATAEPVSAVNLGGDRVSGTSAGRSRSRAASLPKSRSRRLTMAAAVLITAGLLAAGYMAGVGGGSGFDHEFVVESLDPAEDARATVGLISEPSGWEIRLLVEELPAAEPGSYYAAWLQGPDELVPIGSFHQRGGPEEIILWAGVNVDAYDTLLVTLQQEGDPPRPSDVVVLRGSR